MMEWQESYIVVNGVEGSKSTDLRISAFANCIVGKERRARSKKLSGRRRKSHVVRAAVADDQDCRKMVR